MNDYLVTFDLHFSKEELNEYYSKIEEYLKTLSKYVKPTNNVYLVSSDSVSFVEIKENIKKICNNNVYVLVMGLNGAYSSFNLVDINEQLVDFFK